MKIFFFSFFALLNKWVILYMDKLYGDAFPALWYWQEKPVKQYRTGGTGQANRPRTKGAFVPFFLQPFSAGTHTSLGMNPT
jgi:hypothetical protein